MAFGGTEYVATAWALCFLSLLFVAVRLYLRYNRRQGGLNISDWLVVLAWMNFVFQTSIDTKTLTLGLYDGKIQSTATEFGPDAGLATFDETVLALKLEYIEISLYYTEMYCVKLAMLAFYYELFPPSLPRLRVGLTITTVLTIIAWLSSVLYKFLGCQPLPTNWTPGPEYCSTKNSVASNIYELAMHVGTDILIYVLPIFLLKNLTLPRGQKIGVFLTFAVGFLCIVFALAFQVSLMVPKTPIVVSWLLSALEQTWSLIVVCCPTFRILVTQDLRGIWRRRGRSLSMSNSHSSDGNGTIVANIKTSKDFRITLSSRTYDEDTFVGEGEGDTEMGNLKMPGKIYEKREVTYSVETLGSTNNSARITTTVSSMSGRRP